MTNNGPHATETSLHPRLTVARATAAERALFTEAMRGIVIDQPRLVRQVESLAAERSADRAAVRARLDAVAGRSLHDLQTARSRFEHLQTTRTRLLDGAAWAVEMDQELAERRAAIESARVLLEQRVVEQRAAQAALERVLEQRSAARSAMEEADRELQELGVVGLDELGLRRELEVSGSAVRTAKAAHEAAIAKVEAIREEEAALVARHQLLADALAGFASAPTVDDVATDTVRGLLELWIDAAQMGSLDSNAQALADAFEELFADLAHQAAHHGGPRPSTAALEAANALAAQAQAELARLDAAGGAGVLTEAERAEIVAAHEAVLAAEEQIGRRFGGAAARRRLEELREAERALLDARGFGSYVDVVLTGGRYTVSSPERRAVAEALQMALAERDALRRAAQVSPELAHLESERERLLREAAAVLGVDPGSQVVELLRAHPAVSRHVVENLSSALRGLGIRPVGESLAEAAARWVDEQDEARAERDRWRSAAREVEAEVTAIMARLAELAQDRAAAEREQHQAADAVDAAVRSVGAYEAELTARAGEDVGRLKRLSAAEQLRQQMESLAERLAQAENGARAALDAAGRATSDAEVGFDRAAAVLTDTARQARNLAVDLPIERRPEGDPLASLGALALELRAHAALLINEIDAAASVVDNAALTHRENEVAAQSASTGAEGPLRDDWAEGFAQLLEHLAEAPILVLDDPFSGLAPLVRDDLLPMLLDGSVASPTVLLTDAADLLGWAIELPSELGAVMGLDAVAIAVEPMASAALNSGRWDADHQAAPATTGHSVRSAPIDAAPGWAGQR